MSQTEISLCWWFCSGPGRTTVPENLFCPPPPTWSLQQGKKHWVWEAASPRPTQGTSRAWRGLAAPQPWVTPWASIAGLRGWTRVFPVKSVCFRLLSFPETRPHISNSQQRIGLVSTSSWRPYSKNPYFKHELLDATTTSTRQPLICTLQMENWFAYHLKNWSCVFIGFIIKVWNRPCDFFHNWKRHRKPLETEQHVTSTNNREETMNRIWVMAFTIC